MNRFDSLLYLISKRRLLIFNFIGVSIVSVVIALCMTKYYKCEMTFLPPESNHSFGLSSLLGGGFDFPTSDILNSYYSLNTEHLLLILESRDIRMKIIDKFDLIASFHLKKSKRPYYAALNVLKKRIEIEKVEQSGLGFSDVIGYNVSFIDTSAKRSFEMMDYYFCEVQNVVNHISNDKAKKTRLFIEDQIRINHDALASAQKELLDFQMRNKVLDLPMQVKEAIKVYSDLKSSILLKSMELDLNKGDYVSNSRNAFMLENQIKAMKKRLGSLESNDNSDYLVGLNIAPELYRQFTELYKNVEMYEKIDLVLRQTNETAKIQEVKSLATLQIIDSPRLPEYKYKPKRSLVVIILVFTESIFLCLLLLMRQYYLNVLRHEDKYERIVRVFRKSR